MDGWHQVASRDRPMTESGAPKGEASSQLVSLAVKRAQSGDRDAFAFLYARYADNVYGYARSIVHDHHEAEDVTQQLFAKLINVIGKYQEQEVPFLAWMLRVARNVAVDHLRKQQAVPVEQVVVAGEDHRQSSAESLNDLREALASLPQAQREVLVLRHLGGLTPPEIALRTGRTEGSVHGLHHRGRRALQAELMNRGLTPATIDRPLSTDASP